MIRIFAILSAIAAVTVMATPAVAQSKVSQEARDKALAECRQQQAQLGKGASVTAAREQFQACVRAKLAKKR